MLTVLTLFAGADSFEMNCVCFRQRSSFLISLRKETASLYHRCFDRLTFVMSAKQMVCDHSLCLCSLIA